MNLLNNFFYKLLGLYETKKKYKLDLQLFSPLNSNIDPSISTEFIKCNENCKKSIRPKINFIDNLFGRTYDDKVSILCLHQCLVQSNKDTNYFPVNLRLNRRWGFNIILGFNEFFSSMFSLVGLISNYILYNIKIKANLKYSPIQRNVIIYYYAVNAAFISSFMYHFHENIFTRNIDYFTANFAVVIFAIGAVNRVCILFNTTYGLNFLLFTPILIFHMYYMAVIDFNYHYNQIFFSIFAWTGII